LVEETGVFGENHWPVASHWQTLSHNVASSIPRHDRGKKHFFNRTPNWNAKVRSILNILYITCDTQDLQMSLYIQWIDIIYNVYINFFIIVIMYNLLHNIVRIKYYFLYNVTSCNNLWPTSILRTDDGKRGHPPLLL
jgi:hypothetical protein